MGKIFGAIGGALGSIKGISWVVKMIKLSGLVKSLIKEGYHVVDEGMDIIPVAEDMLIQLRLVKFGDTSKENIKQMEVALRIATQLAKEAQEAGKEIKDIADVLRKAKDIWS